MRTQAKYITVTPLSNQEQGFPLADNTLTTTELAYTQKSDLLNQLDKDMSHCSSSWQLLTVM